MFSCVIDITLTNMTFHIPSYDNFQDLNAVEELSRGRYGTGTLLVYDEHLGKHVVAKRLTKRDRTSYERQILTHCRLSDNSFFVKFLGDLPSSNTCYQFVLEHVMEGNLDDLVVKKIGLPDPASKRIIKQLRDALTYLHDGVRIIHGDLRPEHVLLSSVSKCWIKLCSFGKSHPIGACLKMNDKTGKAEVRSPQNRIHGLSSFLQYRTSSLRATEGSRFRQRRGERKSEESIDGAEQTSRRYSAIPAPDASSHTLSELDVHEYTVADVKREIVSEIFSTAFTAPELINATRYIASPASDNWSLAILAIYLVTGATPWKNATVDNTKYTTYIHSDRRGQCLSPILNRKLSKKSSNKSRSSPITSVIGTFRRWNLHDRPISQAFENKMIEILHPNANKRVSIRLPDHWFRRKWSVDDHKWAHYNDCFFDEEWARQ